jgi:hypothetical protein
MSTSGLYLILVKKNSRTISGQECDGKLRLKLRAARCHHDTRKEDSLKMKPTVRKKAQMNK